MTRTRYSLKRATAVAVACLCLAISLSLVSSDAKGAPPVIWPNDTSTLSFLEYYDLEQRSCMRGAPDVSIPDKVNKIDLNSTTDYRVFNTKNIEITKAGCNRFVVDFRVTKYTNTKATIKSFFPTGGAGLVDKLGINYGIEANLNNASDKDQCERMVIALTIAWKKSGSSDFLVTQSTVVPYMWTTSPGDPTKGTCAPGKKALDLENVAPGPGYGVKPTKPVVVDVYRVAISAGQTKVKSDFSNPNANVGNADSTRISHWLYNGKPIPQMAVLHCQNS